MGSIADIMGDTIKRVIKEVNFAKRIGNKSKYTLARDVGVVLPLIYLGILSMVVGLIILPISVMVSIRGS